MNVKFVLFVLAGVLLEILSLRFLNAKIGGLNSLSFIMFTFLTGIFVVRSWGEEHLTSLQARLKNREMPSDENLDGGLMNLAGVAFITPGLFTDLLGFLIVIPASRSLFKDRAVQMFKRKITVGENWFFFKD